MAQTKAHGYFRGIGSAQAGQTVISRHKYDSAVQVATDTVLIGRLLAGHRLDTQRTKVIANGLQPIGNFDLVVDDATDVVILNDQAVAATTFAEFGLTNSAAIEALGVSDVDRDIYLLINSGFATAPAGGALTLVLAQTPGIG